MDFARTGRNTLPASLRRNYPRGGNSGQSTFTGWTNVLACPNLLLDMRQFFCLLVPRKAKS